MFVGVVHDRRELSTSLRRPRGTNRAEIVRARLGSTSLVRPAFRCERDDPIRSVFGGNTHRVN
jgi:hypothetical protein